jgi:hypothetical protein
VTLVATAGSVNLRSLNCFPWESGQMYLRFSAEPSKDCIVQATGDFVTWTGIYTNATATGVLEFIDTDAPLYPHRFYRVVEAP